MKKIITTFSLLGAMVMLSAQTISFENTVIDYGTIKPGADGNREFIVKNTGDKPLIISQVKPSCGCTTPEYSKDPIMPGKTGKIKVHYNTANVGSFQKLIEVFSNDPVNARTVINIKGNVDPNAPEIVIEPKKQVLTPSTTKDKKVKKEKKAKRA